MKKLLAVFAALAIAAAPVTALAEGTSSPTKSDNGGSYSGSNAAPVATTTYTAATNNSGANIGITSALAANWVVNNYSVAAGQVSVDITPSVDMTGTPTTVDVPVYGAFADGTVVDVLHYHNGQLVETIPQLTVVGGWVEFTTSKGFSTFVIVKNGAKANTAAASLVPNTGDQGLGQYAWALGGAVVVAIGAGCVLASTKKNAD